jgi:hypothetical protein
LKNQQAPVAQAPVAQVPVKATVPALKKATPAPAEKVEAPQDQEQTNKFTSALRKAPPPNSTRQALPQTPAVITPNLRKVTPAPKIAAEQSGIPSSDDLPPLPSDLPPIPGLRTSTC